jgi:ABC-2 type transport system permease protein
MAVSNPTQAVTNSTQRRRFGFSRPSANPILIKELRSRMRGPRAFLILTGFLVMLSGVAYLLYSTLQATAQFNSGPIPLSATVGVTTFLGLSFFELFLVAFITPALTAGTISGEREALTYEMLIATPLRPSSILTGKMTAALSYVFLLIFATIPMLSLVFIFGGVTLRDMAVALLMLVVVTITYGTIGVFWSALLGRTGRATVMSYMTIILLVMGPLVPAVMWGIRYQATPPPAFFYGSPFTAMASVITMDPNQGFGFGPFGGLFSLFLMGGWGFGGMPQQLAHPAWHWTVALYTLLTLVLTMATVQLVRPTGRRRISRRQALVNVVLIAALLGAFAFIFEVKDWQQIWTSPDRMQRGGVMMPVEAPELIDPPMGAPDEAIPGLVPTEAPVATATIAPPPTPAPVQP